MRRPEIITDKNDNLLIYWSEEKDGFYFYIALATDNWKTTSLAKLTDAQFSASTSKHNRWLLKEKGILTFTADPMGKDVKGFSILDFDAEKILEIAKWNNR